MLLMFLTLLVSNDDRSSVVRDPQNLNMSDMFVTLCVSNEGTSRDVRVLQS